MVKIIELDHLEYTEAILDSPDFRDKLKRHENYIEDTSKNIKNLLKRCSELLNSASQLHNQQELFSNCLKDFTIGFVGNMNDEEKYIFETLNSISSLIEDIKEYSNKMVSTSKMLFEQIHEFRKEKIDNYRYKKEEYERQTSKYCQQLEKYLSKSARKHVDESNNVNITISSSVASLTAMKQQLTQIGSSGGGDDDRQVKEDTLQFYKKCLDYVNTIQEFEENWFQYFSESVFVFIKNWTTFYHEGYERHLEYDPLFKKSQCNIQVLRGNYEYFKETSKKLINQLLEEPDNYINSYQVMSSDQTALTAKQGYLYLFKKTLGQTSWTKHFCRYYKEDKRFEIILYNQLSSNHHYHSSRNKANFETYFIINCIKSINDKLDKRFIFDLICKSTPITPQTTNTQQTISSATSISSSASSAQLSQTVLTFQALSNDDFKSWFSVMEGKDIPKYQRMSNDPIYILDNNGLKFIQKCISMLEHDKRINEEGIYRKNGVSHKIIQFIEKYCENINVNHKSTKSGSVVSAMMGSNSNNSNSNSSNNNLDLSNSGDEVDTCTITGALKYFLIHCNEPLMTFKYNNDYLKTVRIENLSERLIEINYLLEKLPVINFNALKVLMKHLYTVSRSSKSNKMTISNLSTCFGPTVFRTEQECVTNLYNIKFYSEIIELLIMYHEKIFEKNFKEMVKNNNDFIKPLIATTTGSNATNTTSTITLATGGSTPSIALVVSLPQDSTAHASGHNNPAMIKLRRSQTSTQAKNNRNNGLYNTPPVFQQKHLEGPKKPFTSISNLSISSDSSHDDMNSNSDANTPLSSSASSFTNLKISSSSAPKLLTSSRINVDNKNQNAFKQKRAITIYRCQADNKSELSFEQDTILTNIKPSKENEWFEATTPDGKTGLVPGNYIRFLDD